MQIMSNIGATKLTKIFSKKKNVFPNFSSVITQGDFAPFFVKISIMRSTNVYNTLFVIEKFIYEYE